MRRGGFVCVAFVVCGDGGLSERVQECVKHVFCFACTLMSKPMAVTFPALMLLLDFWPLRDRIGGW